MNSTPPIGHNEGQLTVKSPIFNGYHFGQWKARMEDFIQVEYYELWDRIRIGPTIPMKTINGVLLLTTGINFCLWKMPIDWRKKLWKHIQWSNKIMFPERGLPYCHCVTPDQTFLILSQNQSLDLFLLYKLFIGLCHFM